MVHHPSQTQNGNQTREGAETPHVGAPSQLKFFATSKLTCTYYSVQRDLFLLVMSKRKKRKGGFVPKWNLVILEMLGNIGDVLISGEARAN